jgi:hypothetical protein
MLIELQDENLFYALPLVASLLKLKKATTEKIMIVMPKPT